MLVKWLTLTNFTLMLTIFSCLGDMKQ
uniref:Uncharacterized protein n=1 Tax=Tetranychus urticae TaxID=32264 RepID=T1KLB8_TETUR